MKPFNQLLINLANMLKIKTLVTLIIVATLCIKTLQGVEITSEFIMIATAVVTYYFTKKDNGDDKNGDAKNGHDIKHG